MFVSVSVEIRYDSIVHDGKGGAFAVEYGRARLWQNGVTMRYYRVKFE